MHRVAMQNFKDIGVLPVEDMSEQFWQDTGNLKATIKRLSLADCYCSPLLQPFLLQHHINRQQKNPDTYQ